MFQIFKKKAAVGQEIKLKVTGMHCSSCALNIDDALEEIPGVAKSDTSYAKGEVIVNVDSDKVSREQLVKVIVKEGYQAV